MRDRLFKSSDVDDAAKYRELQTELQLESMQMIQQFVLIASVRS
jgi:hypothetical protein